MVPRLFELEDAGTLRLVEFAYDVMSWHFGLDKLIIVRSTWAPKDVPHLMGIL